MQNLSKLLHSIVKPTLLSAMIGVPLAFGAAPDREQVGRELALAYGEFTMNEALHQIPENCDPGSYNFRNLQAATQACLNSATLYLNRHRGVANQVHQNMAQLRALIDRLQPRDQHVNAQALQHAIGNKMFNGINMIISCANIGGERFLIDLAQNRENLGPVLVHDDR